MRVCRRTVWPIRGGEVPGGRATTGAGIGGRASASGGVAAAAKRWFGSGGGGGETAGNDRTRTQPGVVARPIDEMPGLKSWPLIGSSLALSFHKDFDQQRIHKVFTSLVREHGPILRVNLPRATPTVFVSSPDDIETLLRVTRSDPMRRSFTAIKKVRHEHPTNYFDNKAGILPEQNEEWWRVRSRVQTPMLRPQNLVGYLAQMDQVTLEFLEIISSYQKERGEMPSTFLQDLYKWALESIGLVALDRRLGCFDPTLTKGSTPDQLIRNASLIFECLNLLEVNTPWWKLFPTPTYNKFQKAHDMFLKFTDDLIVETEKELGSKREREPGGKLTLMETLLDTDGLSRKDVVTIILDMLFAGIDTTSHTVAFTLYALSRNKDAQRRAQAEVDAVLRGGGEGAPLTQAHLGRLFFLKACVKEALRLYPIVFGISRVLLHDQVFSGYLVPKGYEVITCGHVVTRDASVFPRPSEFLPERWSRERPLGAIHPFASLPFSHGARMCIGRRIAEAEIYIFLARALHRFDVDYKYDDMEIITNFISGPSEALRFQFTERRA